MHWNLKSEQYGIIKRYVNSIVSSSLNRIKMWIGKYKFKKLLNIFVKYLDNLKWQIYIHIQTIITGNFIHSINVNVVIILV